MFMIAAFLAVSLAPPVGAATVTVPALRDNTLFQDASGLLSSGAGPYFFAGANGSLNVRRGVIAFDVAAALPSGAIVDSVALVLNVSSAPNATPRVIGLHRLLADWGEGASSSTGGAGDASEPGDATWIHTFYPAQSWTSAGGDFAATASATQSVGVSGPHAWSSEAMVADVQSWRDNPSSNFGWALVGIENVASTVRRFDTRENTDPAVRPYLHIVYTAPVATRPSTWGAVKAIYQDPPRAP